MQFAEVAVNSPVGSQGSFSYSIPQGMDLQAGQAVWVPFGPRLLQGIVVELSPTPQVPQTKDISAMVEPPLKLAPTQIDLARWLNIKYLTPLFEALRPFLPPGFERQPRVFVQVSVPIPNEIPLELEPAFEILSQKKKWRLDTAGAALGKDRAHIDKLVKLGLVQRTVELEPVRVRPKTIAYLRLIAAPDEAVTAKLNLNKKSPKMAEALSVLIGQQEPVSVAEIRRITGCTLIQLKSLEQKGLITRIGVPQTRDPLAGRYYTPQSPLMPTPGQQAALEAIYASLDKSGEIPDESNPPVFLLHGVTGSGKTEVYLQALAKTITLGKRGIVLVPEIALTPQTIQRFASRFPGRVAILHSKLSLGEQFDEWRRIEKGDFGVVIGSRSAVFAPQPNVGLIVVDEEHEPSYKQDEGPFRYHAREAAIKRAALEGAVVVLGSATPDVETFYLAQEGRYKLLSLPERYSPYGGRSLAPVKIVDMRTELKTGNRSIFSRALSLSLSQVLSRGQQAILFLNRRGTATFVQCRDCGFALRCRRCDIALTYHQSEGRLVCHQCNYRQRLPDTCPQCNSSRIKYLGLGTQRVEEEVKLAFPPARVLRWDRDAVKGKQDHETILNSFLNREADILIGTQMIAKGLDMPAVTLVGVIMADTSLHFPDFRAAERTFQLISQVAGRAGRGLEKGEVIVQTYSPENYAIIAGARQDYLPFYEQEIAYRRQYRNPPFTHIARLLYSHTNAARCQKEAERLAGLLRDEKESRGLGAIEIIGPTPAFLGRIRGHYRWQIILRGLEPVRLLSGMNLPRGCSIDVDPMNLM